MVTSAFYFNLVSPVSKRRWRAMAQTLLTGNQETGMSQANKLLHLPSFHRSCSGSFSGNFSYGQVLRSCISSQPAHPGRGHDNSNVSPSDASPSFLRHFHFSPVSLTWNCTFQIKHQYLRQTNKR